MSGLDGRYIGAGEQAVIEVIRSAELLSRLGSQCVFDEELSQARFNILIILKYYGGEGISQKQILDRMVSTKGNLSMHIKRLAADGHVEKQRSSHDRRHDIISLTKKGESVLRSKEPEYMRHMEILTAGISRGNAEKVTKLLQELQDQCKAMLESGVGKKSRNA